MNHPEHIEISIDTVFSLFSHHDAHILTHSDIFQLLSFVFIQLGVTRPVGQEDLQAFLKQFDLENRQQIAKQHFGDHKFLNFNRKNAKNYSLPETVELKIPIQPFVQELMAIGCQVVERQRIRLFLANVNNLLQVPKAVQDNDIQRFISEFDKNGDGQLQRSDLQGIECLRFKIKKCRRYE